MREYALSYYKDFHCIASKCKHTCCDCGWETQIDEKTLSFYMGQKGEWEDRFKKSIAYINGKPCFLQHDKICPFFNKQGLCDIILNFGEEALCDVCKTHPRFKNYFSNRVDVGIGLCCEEAARLLLSQEKPIKEVEISFDGKKGRLIRKDKQRLLIKEYVLSLVQDRQFSINERIEKICLNLDIELNMPSLLEIYNKMNTLEILDNKWKDYLNCINNLTWEEILEDNSIEIYLENLLTYFIYRHLVNGEDDNEMISLIKFSIMSTYIIKAIILGLKKVQKIDFELIVDIARMYSSEIEYSDFNTVELISFFNAKSDE